MLYWATYSLYITFVSMHAKSLGIPIAIVIAAIVIAGAIIFDGSKETSAPAVNTTPESDTDVTMVVEPVTAEDHIRGNPNAPIMIVEYSDFDCPFCKNFHETMNQIMDTYGPDGDVAWVFRNFPITSLHPNAVKIAEAGECVAELGGNDAFWEFSDLVFGERGVNEQTDPSKLPEFAKRSGVDQRAFETCLASGRYTETVVSDIKAAIAAGGQGTPHPVIMVGDQQGVIKGAQPYEVVSQIIDNLLSQIEGGNIQ